MAFNMVETEGIWELNGRIDATTSDSFQKELMSVVKRTREDIVLDCKGLEFVSSAGLRVFLIAQKTMSDKKISLVLRNVPVSIGKVFKMTGFDKFLKIEE